MIYLAKDTSKSPFYQIIYLKHGKRTSISTKEILKSEALKFLRDFKEKLKNQKPAEPVRLSRFIKEYEEIISSSKSASYLRSVKLSCRQLKDFTGDVYLEDIGRKTIENFMAITFKRTETGAALYYRSLKAAFNKALHWGYVRENPFIYYKLPKMKTTFPAFITKSEFSEVLKNTGEELYKDLFTVLFYTGLRLSEVINLTWESVDLESRIITVKNTETFSTKNKKERQIPINNILYGTLKNRLPKIMNIKKNTVVFSYGNNDLLKPNTISHVFKKVIRKAGMDESLHIHSLRHSFASNLVQMGVSLYVVKELLGHEEIKTTQIYAHLQKNSLSAAVMLLDADVKTGAK